jgi:hypothetical protein
MKIKFFHAFLIISAITIYIMEGVALNPFAIWNALPLFIGYSIYARGEKNNKPQLIWGAWGFVLCGMALSLYFHMAWMFDWNGLATSSSTSGLIFIFIPFLSVIVGGLGFMLAYAFGIDHLEKMH